MPDPMPPAGPDRDASATALGPAEIFHGDAHLGRDSADQPPAPPSGAATTQRWRFLEVSVRLADDSVRDLCEWLTASRYLLDRRRYNRARRKAVRAVLAGLAHHHGGHR